MRLAYDSVELAEQTGQPVASAYSLVALARVEAVLGLENRCRAHTSATREITAPSGMLVVDNYAGAVDGLLELSYDRADLAVALLEERARQWQTFGAGASTFPQWAADLIEAQIRVGAIEDAQRSLEQLEAQADATGAAWAYGGAARCRGCLVTDGFEEAFAEALDHFGEDTPFERARTLLLLQAAPARWGAAS